METKMLTNEENIKKADNTNKDLGQLGFDEWFQGKSKTVIDDVFSIARIIQVNKNSFKISSGQQECFAELSGKFIYNCDNSIDYPTVGDWVSVHHFDNYSAAIIHDLLPRKSLLKRKDPGKRIGFQLIAANIDYAFIMQSVNSNFDLNRLERYLVMVNESKIKPIVILTKTDLVSNDELDVIKEQIKRFKDKYPFILISNVTNNGIKSLKDILKPRHTYCLLGSSGVGKTTLLNKLLGKSQFDVKEIRNKDDKGKHTTSRRQLICLDSESIFIDTPGMRELSNFDVITGIEETFDDITQYSTECRFANCTHTHEAGCAVLAAVHNRDIDNARYKNFIKLQKESVFYSMSYLDKKKKDKVGGKLRKNYLKTIRKK